VGLFAPEKENSGIFNLSATIKYMDPEILNESQVLARLDDIRSQVSDSQQALEIWNSLSKIKNEFNDLEAKLAKEGSLSGLEVETMILYEMRSIPNLQAQLNPYLVPYLDSVESADEAIELIRKEAHYLEKHIPPLLAVTNRLQADRELAVIENRVSTQKELIEKFGSDSPQGKLAQNVIYNLEGMQRIVADIPGRTDLAISVICYENSYRFANAQGKPLINEPSIAVESDTPSLSSTHDLSR
jgi:hypothetical protein